MDAAMPSKSDLLASPAYSSPPTTLEVLRSTVHRALSSTLGMSKQTCEHIESVVVTRLDTVRAKLEDVTRVVTTSDIYQGTTLTESLRGAMTQIQAASHAFVERGEDVLDRIPSSKLASDAKAGLERASTALANVRRIAVERSTAASTAATTSIQQSITSARTSITEAATALTSLTTLSNRAFSTVDASARAAASSLAPLAALPSRAISTADSSARAAVAASTSAITSLPSRALSTADTAARTVVQTAANITVRAEAIDAKVTGGRGRSIVDYTMNLVAPAVDYVSGLHSEFHSARSAVVA